MVEHIEYYGRVYLWWLGLCIWGVIGATPAAVHDYDTIIGVMFVLWSTLHTMICDLLEL